MEKLAYSLQEAAEKLGGISLRSVQRLVARGDLPTIRVLRRVLIPAQALEALVSAGGRMSHNPTCAEPVASKGVLSCYSNAQGRRSGMPITGVQAATELNALLAQLTEKKRES